MVGFGIGPTIRIIPTEIIAEFECSECEHVEDYIYDEFGDGVEYCIECEGKLNVVAGTVRRMG